jgi:hypothetical protein
VARQAITLADDLASAVRALEVTRLKMERLLKEGRVARRDIEKVYEALFLRAFTEFEALIGELFTGMLTGRIVPPSQQVLPRVEFRSDRVAREIIQAGRDYVDWFPYERTKKLAEAFFRGGRPFTELANAEQQLLQTLLRMRNVIAHRSQHATRAFVRHVIGATPLTPRERTPSGFLRSQLRLFPTPQTRFEFYIIEMVRVARLLCS